MTFTINDLVKYKDLLKSAKNLIRLNFDKPSEIAFYEDGKHLVNLSDIVIAIWNGKKAKGLGGTGDIVHYAISKGKMVVHLNPLTREVLCLS